LVIVSPLTGEVFVWLGTVVVPVRLVTVAARVRVVTGGAAPLAATKTRLRSSCAERWRVNPRRRWRRTTGCSRRTTIVCCGAR